VDEILEINDNPDESGGEIDSAGGGGANEDELRSIEEFQQEMIQRYTLLGRI
jgi:hypothetical protein